MRPFLFLAALCAVPVIAGCPRQSCPTTAGEASGGAGLAYPRGAGEGMWPLGLLSQLDDEALRTRGLQLPITKLWEEGDGLARAAVKIVNGCSASFVSPDGLIFTNHHCAHSAISRNSTTERNLLEQGFVARTRAEELPGQGTTTIQVLQRFRDVTDRVLADLPEDLEARARAMNQRESSIVAECEGRPNTRCYIGRFLDGIPYEGTPDGRIRCTLFETLEIQDVRVVAAPPESMGSYGGEIDNWHWPRHSNDFSLLRAYVAPDGAPAEYSPDNVPYRPAAYLEVSTEGVGPGDFVMVLGYPWRTTRHLTSVEVAEQRDWVFPLRVDLFSEWSRVLHAQAERSPEAAILVSSHIRSIDNSLSHARGRVEAFANVDVLGERQEAESALVAWIAEEAARQEMFGDTLPGIEAAVRDAAATRDRDVILRYMVYGSQLLDFATTIVRWATEQRLPDLEREPGYQNRDQESLRSELEHAQLGLDLETDRAIFLLFLRRAMDLPEGQRIEALDATVGSDRSPAALEAFVGRTYSGSRLGDQASRLALFGQALDALQASDDTMVRLALALAPVQAERERVADVLEQRVAGLRPRLMLAYARSSSELAYPDATATLRVSFGSVMGYSPLDGVLYTPLTTVSGLVAKDTGEEPFNAPAAVLEAAARSRDGRWVDRPLGDVPACFLSDLDTTGGNSGSPVMDSQGRLVGLLFDGVWEDLAGDVTYSPRLSRSIAVDIRYVLWLLDDVMNADHILAELGVGG
jgi:hypothetical protein